MHPRVLAPIALVALSAPLAAQRIEEIPASQANVAKPDDLFLLPAGSWHFAKSHSQGPEACLPDQCEAGFSDGLLAVSVEHSKHFVRIIAGFAKCENAAFSELEVGDKPGKPTFGRITKQVERVVKGLAKTCKMNVPKMPKLDASRLFPKA